MSYRSSWQLAVCGKTSSVEAFLTAMQLVADDRTDANMSEVALHVLLCKKPLIELGGDRVGRLFEDNYTRTDSVWDHAVRSITRLAGAQGLAFAYGRIGEDEGDLEFFDSGHGLMVQAATRFVEVDFEQTEGGAE